jgi:DNA-binding transcriptional LysR family regulator
VRRLERTVGARLFERDSRHVELTEAGAALVPVAADVVRAADAAAAAVARIRRTARPVVEVGYTAASGQLLPRLREVLAGSGTVLHDPRPDGSAVRRGPAVENTEEMLEVVAARRAVCITAASVPGYYRHPGVVFVPVGDLAESEVVLCWARDDGRERVRLLVAAVRELLAAPR